MTDPTGETNTSALRLNFDRRLMLQVRGSTIASDAGLPAYSAMDDALHLTDRAADSLADVCTSTPALMGAAADCVDPLNRVFVMASRKEYRCLPATEAAQVVPEHACELDPR